MEPKPLPFGTLAFLFTDIEASTRRWEQAPEAMRAALARHDRTLRSAVTESGGRVFKTVGDAFCAAFSDAPAAVSAAVRAQRELAGDGFPEVDGLKVRMAIHAGAAEARDGDYFGQPLNRVARLLSAAHGGQVLISRVAADLACGFLPDGTSLIDLGSHRLKDLAEPLDIRQLVAPGLPQDFPPLRSLSGVPNNLPQQVTSLIGRETELLEIKALQEKHRLVTLVGSGGVGKTCISIEIGADRLESYPDGVWFVELAPLSDPILVPEVVAGLFGVSIAAGRSPADAVVGVLKPKRTLLILDNCEHLIAAVAELAGAILRNCPNVALLATSREPLSIQGESTYRMPSLSFPERTEGISAERALDFGSVRLFIERAAAVVPTFAIANDNAPAVAAICKRLDGVALAIELAVPRLKMLKPQELAQRLDDRFRILTGGSRTALPRQQTLRALIDWSYALLSEPERKLLRRLSVFASGWSMAAASAVAAGDGIDDWEIFDLLASLVDKSLVVADASGIETRYRLLETTRQYAFAKLMEGGERGRRRKLAEFLADFAGRAEGAWPTTATGLWLQTYAPELDNLRASLEWAFGPEGDALLGMKLAGRSVRLFMELSLFPEMERWLDAALARSDESTPSGVAARLWLGKALTYTQYNDAEQVPIALRAASLFREAGDTVGEGVALARAGAAHLTNGVTEEGALLLRQADVLLRPLGPTKHLANLLHYLAACHHFSGDSDAAPRMVGEAAAMARAVGDRSGLRNVMNTLGEVQGQAGDPATAAATIKLVIEDALADNDRRALAHTRINIASHLLPTGAVEEARDFAFAGLQDSRTIGMSFYVTIAVEHLALIAALTGRPEQATRLLGYSEAWHRAKGMIRQDTERRGYDRLVAILAEQLAAERRDQLMAEGAAWSEDQAAEEAARV